MIRFLLFATLIFFGFFFIVYQAVSFLLGSNSVKRMMQRDSESLQNELSDLLESLIPLEAEEFKLLSNNPISKKIRKGISGFNKGLLSTIYQEPIFAFALKSYKSENQELLVIKSQKKAYELLFDGEKTKVFINDEAIGTINRKEKLLSLDGKSIMCELVSEESGNTKVIKSMGNDLAHLNLNIVNNTNNSERVFSLFHDFKNNIDDNVVIMTLYYILLKPKLNL